MIHFKETGSKLYPIWLLCAVYKKLEKLDAISWKAYSDFSDIRVIVSHFACWKVSQW